MKKVLVIYHREDNDGVCSAAIVHSALTVRGFDTVRRFHAQYEDGDFEFYGVNYADLSADWAEFNQWLNNPDQSAKKPKMAKWDKFELIFMVDISFNDIDAMNYMWENFGQNFYWCDHHAPIIKASANEGFVHVPGLRRMDQSALLNTWDYLVGEQAPEALQKLSDYDSWAWVNKPQYQADEGESLLAFNTGFTRKSNLRVAWYSALITWYLKGQMEPYNNVVADTEKFGQIAWELEKERVQRAIKSNGDTSWTLNGEKACAIFTTDRINSLSFKSFRGTDVKHGIVLKYMTATNNWVLSAYNVNDDDEMHCGDYLHWAYSGGGHKGAAGCTLSNEKVIELLSTHRV